jgi:hypothetical protein
MDPKNQKSADGTKQRDVGPRVIFLQLLRPMRFTCVDTHCDISCVHQFLLGMFFQFVSGTEI